MKKHSKNILLRFMKLILIFKVDKNGCKDILFRIDVYFTEYLLAIKIDEKGHTDKYLIFEEKRQKALENIKTNTNIKTNKNVL